MRVMRFQDGELATECCGARAGTVRGVVLGCYSCARTNASWTLHDLLVTRRVRWAVSDLAGYLSSVKLNQVTAIVAYVVTP